MNNPKISIIIPTFNRENKILKAIESVLSQTYKDWELIIVDDGSTDKTKDKIQKYLHNEKIKYIYQTNKGVGAARNLGVRNATGDVICFLDSDDQFVPQKLSLQLGGHIKYNKNISICNSIEVRNRIQKRGYRGKDILINKEYFLNNRPPHSASFLMYKKTFFSKLQFDENLKALEDTDLIIRSLEYGDIVYLGTPLVLRFKEIEGDRLSSNYKLKIESYLYFLEKIKRGEYKLSSQIQKKEIAKAYAEIGLFYSLESNYKIGQRYLFKSFNLNPLIKKRYYIVYLLCFFPFLYRIILEISKKVWRVGLIKM